MYVLDEILQVNIDRLPKWEPCSGEDIYLGHSALHAVSVALVLNPATGHVSPQFHVVFDDEFPTNPLIKEDTIPPDFTYLVERISQSGAP